MAWCWAHVRRDLLKAARRWPALEGWLCTWGIAIRALDHLKATRLAQWEAGGALEHPSSACAACHQALKATRRERHERCETPRHEPAWPLATQNVLRSRHHHGDGLTVCVERPEGAMDKNTAERLLRTPVVGRKHDAGSGRVGRAHCAAMMLSVRHPLVLWGLNPHHGRSACLPACAERGGQSPADRSPFVPWQRSAARRARRSRPLPARGPAVGGLAHEHQEPEAATTSEDLLACGRCSNRRLRSASLDRDAAGEVRATGHCLAGAQPVSRVTRASRPILPLAP